MGELRSPEIRGTSTFRDRHAEPAKATMMKCAEKTRSRKPRSREFQEFQVIKIVKGSKGQISKGQNASFRFDNKNLHLTIARVVWVGSIVRSL